MKTITGPRSGRDAFRIPSIQQDGHEDDGGHIFVRPRERDPVRARCTIRAPSFPTIALRGTPPIGSRARGRGIDRHSGGFTSSERSFRGVRVPFGTGKAQRSDLEEGSVREWRTTVEGESSTSDLRATIVD